MPPPHPQPQLNGSLMMSDGESSSEDEDIPFAGMLAHTAQICPLVRAPRSVLRKGLRLARVGCDDVVLDLGCGDGRVLVEAAKLGACAIGIDVNPWCLKRARAAAAKAIDSAGSPLSERIEVLEHDLADLPSLPRYPDATVVYVYLYPKAISKVMLTLQQAVDDGKRVVIYCTSGCSASPGNLISGRAQTAEGHLGMLRLYEKGSSGDDVSLS